MVTDAQPRSKTRRAGRIALAAAGMVVAYFLFYFLLFKPSLPPMDPEGERYMTKVKSGDWKGVSAMHADRGNGEAAVKRWQRLQKRFGPIRSYRQEGAFLRTFPLLTRGGIAYTVQTDKGELFTILDMKARWGFWKVRQTETTFQPSMPFMRNEPQASKS